MSALFTLVSPTSTSYVNFYDGRCDEPNDSELAELEKEIDEQFRQETKEIRPCGHVRHTISTRTGRPIMYNMWCDDWRECNTCRARRIRKFHYRLHDIWMELDSNARAVLLTKPEATKFVRRIRDKVGKDGYWRMPTEEGDWVVYDMRVIDHMSSIDIGELDTEILMATPKGRRQSGGLGRRQREETGVVIEILDFQCYAPDGKITESWNEAVRQTADLHPETAEEIQVACNTRMMAFYNAIINNGGMVQDDRYRKVRVSSSPMWRGEYTGEVIPFSLDLLEPPDWWYKFCPREIK